MSGWSAYASIRPCVQLFPSSSSVSTGSSSWMQMWYGGSYIGQLPQYCSTLPCVRGLCCVLSVCVSMCECMRAY